MCAYIYIYVYIKILLQNVLHAFRPYLNLTRGTFLRSAIEIRGRISFLALILLLAYFCSDEEEHETQINTIN